jgi:hypothetical protein
MDSTLQTCRDFAQCYIDDVIIYSKSFEEHLTPPRAAFARIREKRVKLHPNLENEACHAERTVPRS